MVYNEHEIELAKLQAQLSILVRLESACGRMKILHEGEWIEIDEYRERVSIEIGIHKSKYK